MTTESNCPLCGAPIKIEIDASYAEMSDPYSLMNLRKMVHCPTCVRFLQNSKRAKDQIIYICSLLPHSEESMKEKRLKNLRDLLLAYLGILNKFYNADPPVPFDQAVLDQFSAHPDMSRTILDALSKTVRNAPKQKQLL